jgi:uncharacterized membrane protein YccF (DUF307 family)
MLESENGETFSLLNSGFWLLVVGCWLLVADSISTFVLSIFILSTF